MLTRRFHLHGLFAVLFALMAQLGAGASVPRIDPIVGVGVLCHTDSNTGNAPSHGPSHPVDCPVCPLCIALHAVPAAMAVAGSIPMPPVIGVVLKAELPPPATAPPALHRPPSQPRAPPIFS